MAKLNIKYRNEDYYIGMVMGTNGRKWYMILKSGNPYKAIVNANGKPLMWKTKREVEEYADKHSIYLPDTKWVHTLGGGGTY